MAQVARRWGDDIPFVNVRCLSDLAGRYSHLDFRAFLPVAAHYASLVAHRLAPVILTQAFSTPPGDGVELRWPTLGRSDVRRGDQRIVEGAVAAGGAGGGSRFLEQAAPPS